ncbi:hypothetical protein ACFL3H_04905 [Gemmatimonadota bacterium]
MEDERMEYRSALLVVPLILFASPKVVQQRELSPPESYRGIQLTEYSRDWINLIEWNPYQFPTPDRAQGDYDGDERLDYARLWIKSEGIGFVFMAYLSSMDYEPLKITWSDQRSPWSRAIRTIPPGQHKTHRFYGMGSGGPDSTAVIITTTDSINLAWIESEGTTYVWDKEMKEFKAVGMY